MRFPLPFLRRNVDHNLLDADHDLDLVVMVNEARTPAEIHQIERMGHARLRARRRERGARRHDERSRTAA